jgi:long-subunit fatty acid transport protein
MINSEFDAVNFVKFNMKKYSFLLLLITLLPVSVMSAQEAEKGSSQGDDVEIAMELGIKKKINKQFSAGFDIEYRTRDTGGEFDRIIFSPSLDYKIVKHLKATVGGAYMQVNNDGKTRYRSDGSLKWNRKPKWGPRYRAYAALTGDVDLGRFNVSLRERWQYTYRKKYTAVRDYYNKAGEYNYTEDDVRGSKSYNILRSRLKIEYDIMNCPLTPFVSTELYNDMGNSWRVDKVRYSGGIDWKVNKHNTVGLTYYYQDVHGEDADDDINSHYFCLGYQYKF